jgi:hypothetical protein
MKALVVTVALLGVLVIAAAALWFAAERHYDSCVRDAEAANPVITEEVKPSPADEGEQFERGEAVSKTRITGLEERREAVDDCSRWPF